MYFKELYEELKIWRKIRRIAKENEAILNESNFRVDWIGRIYTVINLPEEMLDRVELHEGYVFMQLRDYDKLFMDIGVADVIFPEISPISDRGAFLLVLTGPKDYMGWWNFLWNLLKLGGIIVLIRILYSLCIKHSEWFTSIWKSLTGLIW